MATKSIYKSRMPY